MYLLKKQRVYDENNDDHNGNVCSEYKITGNKMSRSRAACNVELGNVPREITYLEHASGK